MHTQAAKKSARKKCHHKTCAHCGKSFETDRKHQKTCSSQCRAKASRRRLVICCSNARCGKEFELTPSSYAKGIRCCSNKCKHEHMRLPDRFCQNQACSKKIERQSQGPRKSAIGCDSQKYCCHQCYCDHRWGVDRPRNTLGPAERKRAAAASLRGCVRKRCKDAGVPHDEECTRLAVLERDNWICQMCGVKCNREYLLDPITNAPDWNNAEHDHIVAITTPGSPGNVFPNSQCLCRKCNNKKRDRSSGQFRLDLEGSVRRWENGARGRRQRSSRFSGATLAAGL